MDRATSSAPAAAAAAVAPPPPLPPPQPTTTNTTSGQRHRYPIRRKYLDILRVLCCHLDAVQRTALLRQACPKLVISLVECVLNILRGNVPLNRRYKSILRKHAPLLRKIIAPGQAIESRKRLLIKAQHLVPVIVKPVLSAWNMLGR